MQMERHMTNLHEGHHGKRTFLRKARESVLLAAPVVSKSLDNIECLRV